MGTSLGEGKLNKLRLNIDLVSHPARVEELVNARTHTHTHVHIYMCVSVRGRVCVCVCVCV